MEVETKDISTNDRLKKNRHRPRKSGVFINKKDNLNLPKSRRKLGTVDLPFFFIVITLLIMGIIMMFSASYAWAISEGESGIYYAQRQMIFAGIGLVAMFILSQIDYHIFMKKIIAVSLFVFCLILLILVFTPLGRSHNDARRWLYIGTEFQPSEIMKFSVIILFSMMISENYKLMGNFKFGVLRFFIILAVIAGLLLKQPHLSCTLLICMIGVALIFIGGAKLSHLVSMGLVGLTGISAIVLYKIYAEGFSYFTKRFASWLDPFSDINGDTWQTYQSLVAIGSGGFFGMGLGNSRQKFQYLPESKNDFVFSIVCEELGFAGAITVILLFAFLIFRGFYIASKAPDKFGMLVCIGLTLQVGIQALLNIAVVSNLVPNTGISLPFFSYGGTSLMMLLSQMGVILNISRHVAKDDVGEVKSKKEKKKAIKVLERQ